MAVEATQGDGVFEPSGSILGNLFRDWGRALTLRPIEMERVRESIIPIIIYTAFLSIEIFLGMWLASLVKGTGVEQEMNARLSLGAFCTMLLFFFILGYIYKVALKRMLDASYLSYVYVVALSMTYYPILLFLSRITDKYIIGILLMIASAVISQFFISTSMSRGHPFDSDRETFILGVFTFLLQLGFVFGAFSLFSFFAPLK